MKAVLSVLAIIFQVSAPAPRTPPAPTAQQALAPNTIEDVRISGNRRMSSETIKYNLQTKAGSQLNPATIARDVKTLYALGYFDDITVPEPETGPRGGKIITFVVKEKPFVRKIDYKGIKSITNSDILDKFREKKVGLSVETPYDATKAKKAEGVIKEMLAEKGHQNATVTEETEDVPPNGMNLTFVVDEGPKVKIQKITIEGNHAFTTSQIKGAMKLIKEEGGLSALMGKDTYHELKLADDITRIGILYHEHGYIRAQVLDPVVEVKKVNVARTFPFLKPPFPFGIPMPFGMKQEDRYFITLKIEENDQYRIGDVKVTGNKQFTADQIKGVLGLVPGQIFNETTLRKNFDTLKKIYGSRGFINFTAVPLQDLDDTKKLVNLTINIEEDRQFIVNRITFEGNVTTRDKVIRRNLLVDEGQVFNSQLWDTSLLRLNQLGYFEEIKDEDAEVKPHTNDDRVDINLKLKEKQRNSINFNGGVSAIGGSFLGLGYSTNNFLGLGESMNVTLQGGTRQSTYQFSFTEPYLDNRPITTGFTVFSTKLNYDQARDVYGINPTNIPAGSALNNSLNFTQDHTGFNAVGSYPLRVFHRIGLTYTLDNSQTTAVNQATQAYFNAITAQQRQVFVSTNAGSLSTFYSRRLIPSYSFNSVNNPYNPNRGHSVSLSVEFTGGFLGGNVSLYRPSFTFTGFKPVNNGRNVLAMRFMTSYVQGFSDVSVPYYERFFVGGDFDIRGFDFREISPIAWTVQSVNVPNANGTVTTKSFDNIVYVGGDTQAVFNFEYRIPIAGPVTLAPFLDAGNAWVFKKGELTRAITDSNGVTTLQQVSFLPGTNSGLRVSTGLELQVIMPVIQAPFRLVYALNPWRVDQTFYGPLTGAPIGIHEPAHDFKFTVGRTF